LACSCRIVGRTPLPLGRVTRGLLPLPITNTLLIRVANLQHEERRTQ
jgi:hypothetical protein